MRPIAAIINHLLKQDPSCRKMLFAHQGKKACIDTGVMTITLRVGEDGYFTATDDAVADVTISMSASDIPLILSDMDKAMSYVRIAGDADFANTLSKLSQRLRWDAEEDLSHIVGDIAAVRLVQSGQSVLTTARVQSRKLAENVAEYLVEEKAVLVHPQEVRAFAEDVATIRDDVERLMKRLEKLERQ